MGKLEKKVLEKALDVIQNKINPLLQEHHGWVELVEIGAGQKAVLRFRGACNGCGAIHETLNQLVIPELKKAVPEIKTVEISEGVDQELIELARSLLSKKTPGGE